ncbi:hypothetical protein BK138_32940 [Paenibacillus rhizosphaerae]|uniref:Copper amine oxidase-like N-terminal domain-containing protein n=1 Tax=Paenibacillus rhizosphaerae TaxID=297318 RepID=A0A1R1E530_9BACL|nr:copper amine oxidase N-terminal domain-containing protein [Paenibacillus rhizosphaerae]OMF46901.1 hypothetical protein BK138_32940 [Paenibacillus rhizosphaerae]
MRKFKLLTLFATAALGISMVFGGHNQALASSVKVIGKNGPITSDVAPYLKKGTVLVPINIIGKLGLSNLNMSWDNTHKQVRISYRKVMITVKVNEKYGIIGDEGTPLAQPALIKHGRVMVPVRFVGEALGEPVAWDAKTQTVTVGSSTVSSHAKSALTLERIRVLSLPRVSLKEQINAGGLMTVVCYFPVGRADEYFVKEENRIDYYKVQQGKAVQIWAAETTYDIVENKGLPFFPYKIVQEIGERPSVKGSFIYYKNIGAIAAVFYGIINEQGKAIQLGEADGNKGVIVDIPEEKNYMKH